MKNKEKSIQEPIKIDLSTNFRVPGSYKNKRLTKKRLKFLNKFISMKINDAIKNNEAL